VAYTDVFSEIDWEGSAKWSKVNTIKYKGAWKKALEYFQNDNYPMPPNNQLVLGPQTDKTFRGAYNDLPNICSQIGGHPGWVQYADYPKCPKCKTYMKFLSQIHYDDIYIEREEGVVYVFICKDCKMACTIYQQG